VIADLGSALHDLVERVEQTAALDHPARAVQGALAPLIPHGPVKDLLSGTWMGHPVHPPTVHVPIGAWLSASALDLLGGEDTQAATDLLIAGGLAVALPAAVTGTSDWLDTIGEERRVGLVHAGGNLVVVALMGASLLARRAGRRKLGVTLTLLANGLAGATAYLGGHLSYSRGVGVDETAFHEGPGDWTAVADLAELPEGRPHGADAGGVRLLLVREGDTIHALDNTCTHFGGPLDEGELLDGCVVCPWHQSTFRLADGSVRRGPAVRPQPAYDTRVTDGRVEVRAR
jgi:nitrite reductase/ring-hydroxylating ferredoxin subunit/uncharacterized membrane protein